MVNAEIPTPATSPPRCPWRDRNLAGLALLAAISCGLYVSVAVLSLRFEHNTPATERPILPVVLLLAAAFAIYLIAIRLAARAKQDRSLVTVLLGSSIAFRIILLSSTPIQEIDIYRYLWDGAVLRAGVSPFRYSPQQVRHASIDLSLPDDLERLVRLRDTEPSLKTVLDRIHYGQLPTVYPPVSQLVFAAAAWTTPDEATVAVRIAVMKTWMIAWDVATLVLVMRLLILVRRPLGLCLIYGWCPLLLKEVANSGHLDALAVFLTTLSVYLLVRLWVGGDSAKLAGRVARGRVYEFQFLRPTAHVSEKRFTARTEIRTPDPCFLRSPLFALSAAVVLALAVGAKLYPVILAPLLAVGAARCLGWRWSVATLLVFVITTSFVLWPMVPVELVSRSARQGAGQGGVAPDVTSPQPKAAAAEDDASPPFVQDAQDPSLGLQTFLRRWEMNEFLFLLVFENLKPAKAIKAAETAWFSVLPESLREPLIATMQSHFPVDEWEAAFWLARGITAIAFVVLALWLVRRVSRAADPAVWLESAFLTVAWFWLLSPTQNPWYWTWALPLLPFARSRVWLALSGLVLLYYFRFWLRYHFPAEPVLGTSYRGEVFFDLVMTWVEYAPWFVCLGLGAIFRAGTTRTAPPAAE
ncbi:MAG: hypothetical protein NTY19_48965 [Planctomycetota bacterium]|nr:hypothetical protein [Planctomycetota bacterium]